MILGHSLTGMDVHYLSPSEKDLHRAMEIYTACLMPKYKVLSKPLPNRQKKVSQDRLTF